jgi:energy-coupling factor transporter ATP-binding protein EcfA2
VAIARALATGNPILLTDEPTGELDFRTGVQILELLRAQAQAGKTVLVVTHNRRSLGSVTGVIELSSGHMSSRVLWLRWSWRDLRARWAQVCALAAVIALGTGSYAALLSTSAWRTQSNDASFALLHARPASCAGARQHGPAGPAASPGRPAAARR